MASETRKNIATEVTKLAGTSSSGNCATIVRKAIENALGSTLSRRESAKDYGSSLIEAGFEVVMGIPEIGDVAIYDAIPGHPHGHIQIYTSKGWVSDFNQRDAYPGPDYRNAKAMYVLYRYV